MSDQPPNPAQPIMLTAENLLAILNSIISVPNQNLQVMQQINQQNIDHIVAAVRDQTTVNNALLAHMTAPPPAMDPLRKLRESDPHFPPFTGNPVDFPRWLFEVADRKNQRQLPLEVAVQYALLSLGQYAKGLNPDPSSYSSWANFVDTLKSYFQFHNAMEMLFAQTSQWKMNGNWPAFHALVQCYKDFLPIELHPALIINFIAGLDPHMARKVNKNPKPTTLDEAITRAWDYFRSANLQDFMSYSTFPHLQQSAFSPAMAPLAPTHTPVFPSVTPTSTSSSPFQTAPSASTAAPPPATAPSHPAVSMELDAMRQSAFSFPYSGPTLAYGQVQQQMASYNPHHLRPAMRTDAYHQAMQHAAVQFHAF